MSRPSTEQIYRARIDQALRQLGDVYLWLANEVEAGDTAVAVHRDKIKEAIIVLSGSSDSEKSVA